MSNMGGDLLLHERRVLGEGEFVEMVVWRVPSPLRGSVHSLKYRLAYVVERRCVLRYDNEDGKGDHRHLRGLEAAYVFTTAERLLRDFWSDVDRERAK